MPHVALVTCRTLPEPDPDEQLLLDACRDAGIDAQMAAWEDSLDWARFDLAIVRSTWNFYEDPPGFRKWIEETSKATRLLNPAGLMLRTIDKTYLTELQQLGVEIVPTRFLENADDLEEIIQAESWGQFVIKPTVSASSYMTKFFSKNQLTEATEFASEVARTQQVMVQPYLSAVENGGEVALIHIESELTHGVLKSPRFVGQDEQVSAAIVPTKEQARAAQKAMATIKEPWLYARVNLMLSDDGRWLLSELELIEPSLFFLQHPPALDRFVRAINRLLEASAINPVPVVH